MEGGIDPNAPLDYAEFELFPSQNRYEVCICSDKKVETVASGILEQLLLYSPAAKNLHSKKSNASFKIQLPQAFRGAEWFTKSMLTRFLRIVDSPDILNVSNKFENEISQLEETRKFQLSMNSHLNRLGSREADDGRLNSTMPTTDAEVNFVSSDASKNKLLRAMDLRLAASRDELAAAFCQATGTCSPEEIIDLQIFSHYFGAMHIRNSFRRFTELSQVGRIVDFPDGEKFLFENYSRTEKTNNTDGNVQTSRSSTLDTPVKYSVSPAKVAKLERQSSTEKSSLSSEDDKPSVERSRPVVRSAMSRRSASPMRSVRIGRSGSHRPSALTIKSLNHVSGRERLLSQMDAANSAEEGSEQPPRKSDNNAQRISVQAAISLFESKQIDHTVDIQKMRSSLNASSISANKSVLRRWGSGMSAVSVQCSADIARESSVQSNLNNSAGPAIAHSSQEMQQESDFRSGRQTHVETLEVDSRSESSESNPSEVSGDTVCTQQEESSQNFTASEEWSQKKTAELNQLLASMLESKHMKDQKKASDSNQKKNVPGENRGGFYDHYKQKRDDKLRGEVSGKRAEKEAQIKNMQKFLEERKVEMASTNAKDVGKRHTVSTSQKSTKTSSPMTKFKKEMSKPAVVKKTSSKAFLPETRKSWTSNPSPRTAGTSPAKTPAGTSSTASAPKREKPQPVSSLPRSSPNMERPQLNPKTVKVPQFDSYKSVKGVNEKQQQTTKSGKLTKTKARTPSEDHSFTAKPVLYNKVTRKSSVVPLESKPLLRKGSRVPSSGSPVVKSKFLSLPEESLRDSKRVIKAEENELVIGSFSPVCLQQEESNLDGMEIHSDKEPESQLITPDECRDTGSANQVITSVDINAESLVESTDKTGNEEESVISPAAWVVIEDYQDEPIQYDDRSSETETAVNVASVRNTRLRMRHSLSKMLLKETSKPDTVEWGIAENPPAMVYQKNAPKGLKRLLKFVRKSKLDAHSSSWSSPSGFSDGEDEAEESKTSKKNAENLLRKASLNAKNYGPQRSDSRKFYEKYSATRSFFSLSAFKGSKPNDTKLQLN